MAVRLADYAQVTVERAPERSTAPAPNPYDYAKTAETIVITPERAQVRPPDSTLGLSLWAWIERRRARYNEVRADEVLAAEIAQTNEQAAIVETRIEEFWTQARFDSSVQKFFGGAAAGVGAGVSLGLTVGLAAGAAAGTSVPIIGTIIGGVVGAAAGVIVAFIPLSYWEFFDAYRNMLEALTVDERYLVYGTFRKLSDIAREKDQKPHYPAWQLIDCPLFCIRDGIANVVYTLYQALWERDSIPEDPELVPWALAAATAELEPEQTLGGSWAWNTVVKDGKGSQWLVPAMLENGHMTARSLRLMAGVGDVSEMPITDALKQRLLAAERAL
jgi:hypothetical protein